MKARSAATLGSLALALACAIGCSSPTLRERYEELDGMEKQTFLAFYPELTPEARLAILGRLDDTQALFRYVRLHASDANKDLQLVQELNSDPGKHRLRGLEIHGGPAGPVIGGDSLELRAQLVYTDGRAVDATEDSAWQVQPAIATIERGKLRFGCLASDVVVSADFLGESQGQRRIELRKPLRALDLRVSEEDVTAARGEFIRLRLLASCQDGTETDVTCQADWSLAATDPGEKSELLGCGIIRRPSRRATHAVVTARYGDLSVTRDLELPRPPGG